MPPATLTLTLIILGIFLLLRILPDSMGQLAVALFALFTPRFGMALETADPLQLLLSGVSLVTHAFLHLSWLHVGVNAGFLLAFGSAYERLAGGRAMVTVFVLAAIGGGLTQTLSDDFAFVLGASGGVAGLMGAVMRVMMTDPASARRRRLGRSAVLALIGINLLIGLFGGGVVGLNAGIAWQAHLGGLAVGLLLGGRRPRPTPPPPPPNA
ncbi:MAG: rhomboid family intramembrane serine protease [Inquilinaceae bacterium]